MDLLINTYDSSSDEDRSKKEEEKGIDKKEEVEKLTTWKKGKIINSTPSINENLIKNKLNEMNGVNALILRKQYNIKRQESEEEKVLPDVNKFMKSVNGAIITKEAIDESSFRREINNFQEKKINNNNNIIKKKKRKRKFNKIEEALNNLQADKGSSSSSSVWDSDNIWLKNDNTININENKNDRELGTLTKEQKEWIAEDIILAKKRKKHHDIDLHTSQDTGIDDTTTSSSSSVRYEETKTYEHGRALTMKKEEWYEPSKGLNIHRSEGDRDIVPRRCTHRYTGHSKGVQCIQFFPTYGHLLLSGSLDSTIKLWDVNSDRELLRTYDGHSEGVRALAFSNEGHQFISSSYDHLLRVWDTETGQCMNTIQHPTNQTKSIFYDIKYYPLNNNLILCSSSDNKIYTFDLVSGQVVQEYNYHLQAVNSINFFDNNRKFISTSDDKKILIWEWDIPVPLKYITSPDMFSIPSTCIHPQDTYMVCNSMDNKAITYTLKNKSNVKKYNKKIFLGHYIKGYGCQLSFSKYGKYLASGDGHGSIYFWSFGSTKIVKKFQGHTKPCMDVKWHPYINGLLASAGWDGVVKLWE